KDELALESPTSDEPHRWLAIRSNTIRSGVVNPPHGEDAYGLHGCVLEVTPYFLSISPLDVEYLELLYGFDLAAGGNHNAIVANALISSSPLASLLDVPGAHPIDFQPVFGLRLHDLGLEGGNGGGERWSGGPVEAHFEVKTRSAERPPAANGDIHDHVSEGEPISVYLTLRIHDPAQELRELPEALHRLSELGERLVETRLVPGLLAPLREEILSGGHGTGAL